ncbi:PucR family transcriptional regulator ligand-binding domain-containing protein [Streptomyces sp. WMMC500]|uniref:helix-turn-helix domain-containing protein n=1 Tax=Streptomyces sp. WMMC500 TaxID=3015154 RepID=UPI00248AA61B|nr:PucR family transcriptional regulator [Streptomyces sp. WMMC500]WBB62738.1 PucR family transcriptional regulator ligand-binding domain-containing protein [Streptomyces sp. WMMC500]
MPTLASLVRHPTLKLSVLTGADELGVAVRWAQTSELIDPVPYLEGGELILTTALKLDVEDADAARRYMRRLADAGVVGVGFGVGVNFDAVPEALLAAAREARVPLLEVPRTTPFIAISKVVSAAIAADQYRALTRGFEAQRDLTRAALGADGPATVVSRLAAHVRGWAALYDPAGEVLAVSPARAAARAEALRGDVARLRRRQAPASAVVAGVRAADVADAGDSADVDGAGGAGAGGAGAGGGPRNGAPAASGASAVRPPADRPAAETDEDRVELQSLGSGRRCCGVLAVGTGGKLAPAERYAVHAAVSLLTLVTERSSAFSAAEQRLGTAVLRLLLAGQPDHARSVAGPLYGGLLDAPVRLLVAEAAAPVAPVGEGDPEPLPEALAELADALDAAAAGSGEAFLAVPDAGRLVVLAADGGAVAEAAAQHAARVEAAHPGAVGQARGSGAGQGTLPLVAGVSAPAGPAVVTVAYKQAEQALSVARRRGRVLVEHEDVTAGSVVDLLADDAVQAFADGTLRALREHDERGRGDLVASLRAWLSRHGQWDAAAADLGVHRHTLRYRMRRVEEILGRSLDDPDTRMELWLALKA